MGDATAGTDGGAKAESAREILAELFAVIRQRQRQRPAGSYVARLMAGAPDTVLRKVTEEAGEVVLAAKDLAAKDESELEPLVHELADLWFHSLVLLAWAGGDLDQILAELARRRQ